MFYGPHIVQQKMSKITRSNTRSFFDPDVHFKKQTNLIKYFSGFAPFGQKSKKEQNQLNIMALLSSQMKNLEQEPA